MSQGYRSAAHHRQHRCRDWQHWVGQSVGLAPVKSHPSAPVTRSSGMINTIQHHVQRPLSNDLGVAQVLPHHRELHCAERQGLTSTHRTSPRARRTSLAIISLSMMPFNSGARTMYWSQMNTALFTIGRRRLVDGRNRARDRRRPSSQYQLASDDKPDPHEPHRRWVPARACSSAYALVNSQAVYEGQRRCRSNQRVFIADPQRVPPGCSATRPPPGRATSHQPGRR